MVLPVSSSVFDSAGYLRTGIIVFVRMEPTVALTVMPNEIAGAKSESLVHSTQGENYETPW